MKLIVLFALFAFAHCTSIIVNTTATIKFTDSQFIAKTDTGLMNVSIIVNDMRCEKCIFAKKCEFSISPFGKIEDPVIVINSVLGDMIIVDYETNDRLLYKLICTLGIAVLCAMISYFVFTAPFVFTKMAAIIFD